LQTRGPAALKALSHKLVRVRLTRSVYTSVSRQSALGQAWVTRHWKGRGVVIDRFELVSWPVWAGATLPTAASLAANSVMVGGLDNERAKRLEWTGRDALRRARLSTQNTTHEDTETQLSRQNINQSWICRVA